MLIEWRGGKRFFHRRESGFQQFQIYCLHEVFGLSSLRNQSAKSGGRSTRWGGGIGAVTIHLRRNLNTNYTIDSRQTTNGEQSQSYDCSWKSDSMRWFTMEFGRHSMVRLHVIQTSSKELHAHQSTRATSWVFLHVLAYLLISAVTSSINRSTLFNCLWIHFLSFQWQIFPRKRGLWPPHFQWKWKWKSFFYSKTSTFSWA